MTAAPFAAGGAARGELPAMIVIATGVLMLSAPIGLQVVWLVVLGVAAVVLRAGRSTTSGPDAGPTDGPAAA